MEYIIENDISMTLALAVIERFAPQDVRKRMLERVGEFHDAGGQVVLGTDAGIPGVFFDPSVHQELELFVESGLSPQEALQSAAIKAAEALRSDEIGAIAPGKAADLIVIDGVLQKILKTFSMWLKYFGMAG